mgnify:FL=1
MKFNGRSAEDSSLYTVLNLLLPYKNPLIGLQLDMKGIAISQGSACSSGASKPSMVLMSVLSEDDLDNCTPVRVSFSHFTKKSDIDAFINALEEVGTQFVIEKTDSLHR